jgi:hypothetical protein
MLNADLLLCIHCKRTELSGSGVLDWRLDKISAMHSKRQLAIGLTDTLLWK